MSLITLAAEAAPAAAAAVAADPWLIARAKEVEAILWPAFIGFLTAATPIVGIWALSWVRTVFKAKAVNEAAPSLQRSIESGLRQEFLKTGIPENGVPHPDSIDRVVESTKRDNPPAVATLAETDASLRKKVEAVAPSVGGALADDLARIRAVSGR